jgi:hypothetical protein
MILQVVHARRTDNRPRRPRQKSEQDNNAPGQQNDRKPCPLVLDTLMTGEASRIALVADDDEFFRAALHTILVKQLGFSQVIETASLD